MSEVLDLASRPLILIVDDTPNNLTLMNNLLREQYRTKLAISGKKALQITGSDELPDLILLDIMMPDMDGYEVCRRLKSDPKTRDIPVIFLTAKSEVADEQQGFAIGAVDYITKPVSPPLVEARIRTHLALKQSQDFLKNQNAWLEEKVQQRTSEISALQNATIMAMASLAETRDDETGNHIRRTQRYLKILVEKLRVNPKFSAYLTEDTIETLLKSAPLHDLGKVGIPDHILLKPGRLTPEEFEIMKTHTALGKKAIEAAEALLDSPCSFLQTAREIVYSHHEKWDGSGYPLGLAGGAIPLSARLMALADVYDALVSKRIYKAPVPHQDALSIILASSGTHFDPDIVEAFQNIHQEFYAVAERFSDAPGIAD